MSIRTPVMGVISALSKGLRIQGCSGATRMPCDTPRVVLPSGPWDSVYVDAAIDHFTRFVEAMPMIRLTTESYVVGWLQHLVSRYGAMMRRLTRGSGVELRERTGGRLLQGGGALQWGAEGPIADGARGDWAGLDTRRA